MLDIDRIWASLHEPYAYKRSKLPVNVVTTDEKVDLNVPARQTVLVIPEQEIYHITVSYRNNFCKYLRGQVSETGKLVPYCTGQTYTTLTRERDGQVIYTYSPGLLPA